MEGLVDEGRDLIDDDWLAGGAAELAGGVEHGQRAGRQVGDAGEAELDGGDVGAAEGGLDSSERVASGRLGSKVMFMRAPCSPLRPVGRGRRLAALVGGHEDLAELEDHRIRVGPGADVVDGGLHQRGDEGLELGAVEAGGLAQGGGDPGGAEELEDLLRQGLDLLVDGGAAPAHAGREAGVLLVRHVRLHVGEGHELRGQRAIVADHVGQEDRVGPAVAQVEDGADGVGEGVVDPDEGVGEGQAAIVAALCIFWRASRSLPWWTAWGRCSKTIRAACIARPSV